MGAGPPNTDPCEIRVRAVSPVMIRVRDSTSPRGPFQEEFRKFAQTHALPLIESDQVLTNPASPTNDMGTYFQDQCHMTEVGTEKFGQGLAEFLSWTSGLLLVTSEWIFEEPGDEGFPANRTAEIETSATKAGTKLTGSGLASGCGAPALPPRPSLLRRSRWDGVPASARRALDRCSSRRPKPRSRSNDDSPRQHLHQSRVPHPANRTPMPCPRNGAGFLGSYPTSPGTLQWQRVSVPAAPNRSEREPADFPPGMLPPRNAPLPVRNSQASGSNQHSNLASCVSS